MKKISLNHITKADYTSHLTRQRTHCVSLGNGSITYFSNINKAEEFISKTNRFLNERFFDINELYIDVFIHFQRNWFYFNNNDTLSRLETICYNNFATINDCMYMVYSRSHYENGNHLVFKHTYNICDALINVVDILQNLHVSRGNYAESNIMKAIIRRINYIKLLIEINPNNEIAIKT